MPQTAITHDIRRDLVGLLPRIRRFATTLAGDGLDADELVQSACQRAVAKSGQWNGDGRLESWIYRIMRQVWTEDSRRKKSRAAGTRNNVTDIRDAVRDRAGGDSDALRQLVASMPNGSASLFLLVCVEGHSHKEAADIMGVADQTVASKIAAARLYFASAAHTYSHG